MRNGYRLEPTTHCMDRRAYLRTSGVAVAAALAGCLDGTGDDGGEPVGSGGSGGADGATPTDGGDDVIQAANEFGYETTTTEGVAVPLVPVADAIEWYEAGTVFVDARSETAYERGRVSGAVFSPAPDGQDRDDPVADVPTAERLVTYCGCPHHLSSLRAASLIRAGRLDTYALDEGFRTWVERGHPVEGSAVEDLPAVYEVSGRTDPSHAEAYAWARHDPTGQREAAPIDGSGRFTLRVGFHGVGPSDPVRLTTPAAERTAPLGDLAAGTVRL